MRSQQETSLTDFLMNLIKAGIGRKTKEGYEKEAKKGFCRIKASADRMGRFGCDSAGGGTKKKEWKKRSSRLRT
jgi:hypothetical protein